MHKYSANSRGLSNIQDYKQKCQFEGGLQARKGITVSSIEIKNSEFRGFLAWGC